MCDVTASCKTAVHVMTVYAVSSMVSTISSDDEILSPSYIAVVGLNLAETYDCRQGDFSSLHVSPLSVLGNSPGIVPGSRIPYML